MASEQSVADKAAVQTIYVDHHHWLRAWMRRRLGCAHQAEDLAQDTFVHVLGNAAPSAIEEPRAFLTTIAQRVLVSFWRRRSLEQAWLDALAAQPPAFAPSAEDYAIVRQAVESIDRQLDGLPLRVKQAFLLNRLEGLTHQVIATELGVSIASVERYVRQAYLHLLAGSAALTP
ncbi:sigma-70 family RNA polymerase sigma factor [Pseudorhodoferax soli]|uniref:RNA polymerase sigma factor n=1 Tax=Pseudorhodoferax soli TaxID=545864 RepID=A0A368XKY0_9BURK|nr:sigma-70 family RNA polymerase sigma factor [Pseudorhodoferax soli]RCW68623.1 RNA polymerase sigma-70 factor (ECF subfamily) [Pseudorhodoferax soli]